MTAPMPETMSPREKVRKSIIDVMKPHDADVTLGRVDLTADAIIAALAASGDHAELARLAEINKAYGFLVQVKPDDLLALIAEVAALREERDAYFGMANRSEDAWLKAERKLTEARETLIQADLTIRSFPGADQSHVEFIRTFLSKEAERGLPLPPAPGAEDE